MPSSQSAEYRQTGLVKMTNLAIAVVIFSIGIIAFYLFTTRFSFMPGVALATVIVIGSIYFLATVLRSRIMIEGTRIKIRNAFGEQAADLTEIEGIRDIHGKYGASVIGKLLCLKDGRGTIRIPMTVLDLDVRFRDWLNQLPNLDLRDR
jgi:hypothetical protein